MKRDMDLARQIMLELEEAPSFGEWVKIAPTGWSEQEVNYHVMLLAKAGLIEADDVSESESTEWAAKISPCKDTTFWTQQKTKPSGKRQKNMSKIKVERLLLKF